MSAANSATHEIPPASGGSPFPHRLFVLPERPVLILLILAAIAMRLAFPSRLAVEHFDEGVYASDLWFGPEDHHAYPRQYLYAPPLVPRLIEWTLILSGPSNGGAIALSLVAGILTIPLVWWVGREWFGQIAGLIAALLATFSDMHVFYSRAALTDVPLCLLLLAAVYLAWKGMISGRAGVLVAAGVVTGAAWWTKYNGWLPLAISLSALFPVGMLHRRSTPRSPKLAVRWLIIAAVAVLVWSPWLLELQGLGGYAVVAANHRGYLTGLPGWFESLRVQAQHFLQLEGFADVLTIAPLASLSANSLLGRSRFTRNALPERLRLPCAVFFGSALGVVAPGILLAAAGVSGIIVMIRSALRDERIGTGKTNHALAAWLLSAWFIGLSFSVPLYAPYPRLMLPWSIACWLSAGYFLQSIVTAPMVEFRARSRVWPARLLMVLAAIVLVAFIGLLSPPGLPACKRWVPGWESRRSLADLAPDIVEDACTDARLNPGTELDRIVVYVYGEPALLFQLRLQRVEHVVPVMHLAFAKPGARAPQLPTFLVVGPHAHQTAGFAEQFQEATGQLRLVQLYDSRPSKLIRFDRRPQNPDEDNAASPPMERLDLYRVE